MVTEGAVAREASAAAVGQTSTDHQILRQLETHPLLPLPPLLQHSHREHAAGIAASVTRV